MSASDRHPNTFNTFPVSFFLDYVANTTDAA